MRTLINFSSRTSSVARPLVLLLISITSRKLVLGFSPFLVHRTGGCPRTSLSSTASASLLSSTATATATELPDSLEDAAIRAAEASAAFSEASGGSMARCRVDFDTTVGDETFTLLKASTEFMQTFVTALSTALIAGVQQARQDEYMRVVQARTELKQLQEEEDDEQESSSVSKEDRIDELLQLIQRQGRLAGDDAAWTGPRARVYFPDEGNAALARRDWQAKVPACIQFSSCSRIQVQDITKDELVFFYCPKAAESDLVEQILQKHEQVSTNLKLTVFVNPNLVDMGVTGFGLAGRLLRERLIDPLQHTYYLRTLSWGALTRQWPNLYSVWQEDEDANGGYRLIQTMQRLPSNPEVEDIYDRENSGGVSGEGGGGPGVLDQLGDFINGMMRL